MPGFLPSLPVGSGCSEPAYDGHWSHAQNMRPNVIAWCHVDVQMCGEQLWSQLWLLFIPCWEQSLSPRLCPSISPQVVGPDPTSSH